MLTIFLVAKALKGLDGLQSIFDETGGYAIPRGKIANVHDVCVNSTDVVAYHEGG